MKQDSGTACRIWICRTKRVRREFEQVADFWLDMGVDGFRLDAVKEYVTGSVEDNVEILSWFAIMSMARTRRIIWCVMLDRSEYLCAILRERRGQHV